MNLQSDIHEQPRTSPNHRRRAIVGPALIVVCIIHSMLAIAAATTVWESALLDGWVGAFTGSERQMVLWFLITGLVGIVAGIAISVVEHLQRLPWAISGPLMLVAIFGVIASPTSGFWLVLGVAILGLLRSAIK